MIYIILSIYLLIGNALTVYTYIINKKENDHISELLLEFIGWRKFVIAFCAFLLTILVAPVNVALSYLIFKVSMMEKI